MRCDNLIWFKDLDTIRQAAFSDIYDVMKEFRLSLNEISQVETGDINFRVDEEEILLTRYNGASTIE